MSDHDTNAASVPTAIALAQAARGRFWGLIIRKQGVSRGRGPSKKVFGDDLVHVVIYGGFDYGNLVRRSREQLQSMNPSEIVADFAAKGITDGNGNPIRLADVCKAVADLDESFRKSLDGTNVSTVEHVYEPLVVDGETVRGAKVYKCIKDDPVHKCHCRACTGDPKAPVEGQINLQGLKIGETVVEAAENGPIPPSKSRADVVAKRVIRSRLPVGRYVSYRLEPGQDYILRVGPEAAIAATKDGVVCDPVRVKAAMKDALAG